MVTAANTTSGVSKALSEDHRKKMVKNAKIVPVMNKEQRKGAIGDLLEFPQDVVNTYMTKYAEEIFEPKRILSNGDWLKSYREPD